MFIAPKIPKTLPSSSGAAFESWCCRISGIDVDVAPLELFILEDRVSTNIALLAELRTVLLEKPRTAGIHPKQRGTGIEAWTLGYSLELVSLVLGAFSGQVG